MNKKTFTEGVLSDCTSIVIGMSFSTDKCATCSRIFERKDYRTKKEWIDSAYKAFAFQYKKNHPMYLDVHIIRDYTMFVRNEKLGTDVAV